MAIGAPLLPGVRPVSGLDYARFLTERRLRGEQIDVERERIDLRKELALLDENFRRSTLALEKEQIELAKWERAYQLGGNKWASSTPAGKAGLDRLAGGKWDAVDPNTGNYIIGPNAMLNERVAEIRNEALQKYDVLKNEKDARTVALVALGATQGIRDIAEAGAAERRGELAGAQAERLKKLYPFEIQSMVADNQLTLTQAERIQELIPFEKRLSEAHAQAYESGAVLDRARAKVADATAKRISELTNDELLKLRADRDLTIAETATINEMRPFKKRFINAQIAEMDSRTKLNFERESRMRLLAPHEVDELRSRTQANISEIYRNYNLTDAQIDELGAQAKYHMSRAKKGDWTSVGIAEKNGMPTVILYDKANHQIAAVGVPGAETVSGARARERAERAPDPVIEKLVARTAKKGDPLHKVGIFSRLPNRAKAFEVAEYLRSNNRRAIVYEAPRGIKGKEYVVRSWDVNGAPLIFGDRRVLDDPEVKVISTESGERGTTVQQRQPARGTPEQRQDEIVDDLFRGMEKP